MSLALSVTIMSFPGVEPQYFQTTTGKVLWLISHGNFPFKCEVSSSLDSSLSAANLFKLHILLLDFVAHHTCILKRHPQEWLLDPQGVKSSEVGFQPSSFHHHREWGQSIIYECSFPRDTITKIMKVVNDSHHHQPTVQHLHNNRWWWCWWSTDVKGELIHFC